jgi:hypothetical protein
MQASQIRRQQNLSNFRERATDIVIPFHQTADLISGRQARKTGFGNVKGPKQAIHFFFPFPFGIDLLNRRKSTPLNRTRVKRLNLCTLRIACRRISAPHTRRVQKFIRLHFFDDFQCYALKFLKRRIAPHEEETMVRKTTDSQHRGSDLLVHDTTSFRFPQCCLRASANRQDRARR